MKGMNQNSPLEFCADRGDQSFFITFDHSHLQCKLAIENVIRTLSELRQDARISIHGMHSRI